jgi:hypothetical protein
MTEGRPCERAPPAIARCAEPSSDQKTIEVLDELAIEYERRADRLEGQGSFGDPKSWRAKLRSADRRSSPTEVKAGPIVNLLAVETAYMPAVIGPKLAGFVIAAAPGPQPVHCGQAVLRRNEDAVDVELLPAIARSAATVVRVRAALYCANELSSVVILHVLQLSGTSPPQL